MSTGCNLEILGEGSTSCCNQLQRSRHTEKRLLPKPFLTQMFQLIALSSAEPCASASAAHGQGKAGGDLAIAAQTLEAVAVNLAKEINTHTARHGLLLPKGGGGRTGRRKANESLILQVKETPRTSCIVEEKKALPLN